MKYLKVLAISLILVLSATAAQAKGKPIKDRVTLMAVGSDQDATGFASFSFKTTGKGIKQDLQVKVERVASSTLFMLLVDGNVIDTFSTNPGGTFQAKYESNPTG